MKGPFDNKIDNLVSRIAAYRSQHKERAQSISTAAEKKFGNIGAFVNELRPILKARFPEIEPQVMLESWVKGVTGATSTLKLKTATREKAIKLSMSFEQSAVQIDGNAVSSHDALKVLADEIEEFFKEP